MFPLTAPEEEESSVSAYKAVFYNLLLLFLLLHLCFFPHIMGFGDLKSASGIKVLNDFLSDRSYIEG